MTDSLRPEGNYPGRMTSPQPRTSPESQGISSHALLRFLDGCEQAGLELHAFELRRHGRTLAEGAWKPFSLEAPHALYSVSKSFVSTAVGFAVSEGLLGLDDPVLSSFPEHAPAEVGAHLAAMRVRDLLTMTTGHAEDVTGPLFERQPQAWAHTFLAQPVPYQPGTHFVYNSAATYMLAAMLERRSGLSLLEYLEPRLFGPLGIAGATWETNAEGLAVGGWGLSLPVGALAQLGQLYLQRGVWEGRPLLPQGWVDRATSAQVSNGDPDAPAAGDWAQGYGFQFWRCRHGAYRADGAFGQYIVVLPGQQAVLAVLSAVDDMQAVLDEVWTHLLPAFRDEPLQADAEALTGLLGRCADLTIRVVKGEPRSPTAALLRGRTFVFASNAWKLQRLSFGELEGEVDFTLTYAHGSYGHRAGFGHWTEGSTPGPLVGLTPSPPIRWAGTAAWTEPGTLTVHLLELENSGTLSLYLRALDGGDRLEAQARFLHSFRQEGPLSTVGTLKG